MERPATPDWIRESLRASAEELRSFARTAAAVIVHPGRFINEWSDGRRPALNPSAFLATSAALFGLAREALGGSGDEPFLLKLAAAGAPHAHYLLVGLLCHAVLRLLGRPGPLRLSLGAALYLGGAAGMLFTLFEYALAVVATRATGAASIDELLANGPWVWRAIIFGGTFAGFSWVNGVLGHLLGAAHRPRRWHLAVAMTVALTAIALLYGALPPTSAVGAHFVIWIARSPFSIRPSLVF